MNLWNKKNLSAQNMLRGKISHGGDAIVFIELWF